MREYLTIALLVIGYWHPWAWLVVWMWARCEKHQCLRCERRDLGRPAAEVLKLHQGGKRDDAA